MTQFNLDTMKLWPTFGWPLSSTTTLTTTTSSPSLSVYSYAIGDFDPKLVLDFTKGTYKTGGNDSTLTDSITHSRGSLATMNDKDDVDLFGGLEQFTSATQYSSSNTNTVQLVGNTDVSILDNGNLRLLATSSGLYGVAKKITVEPLTNYTLSYGVSKQPLNDYVKIGTNPNYANIKNYYEFIFNNSKSQNIN